MAFRFTRPWDFQPSNKIITLNDLRDDADVVAALPLGAATTAALAGKADLVGGVIATSQIPALTISDTAVVASQAAMLALTAQRGDFAVRSDLTPAQVFILAADDPTVLANWINVTTSANVASVNGQVGVVVLGKSDVGLGNVDNTSDANKPISTATQTALDAKQPLDGDLTAIGNLVSAANKVPYATGAGAWALADFTSFGRSLVDDADAATARGTLGLGLESTGSWTPTVTAETGTLTSYTASGTYLAIGPKLVIYWATLTITNAGTGTNGLRFTTPTSIAGGVSHMGTARRSDSGGYEASVTRASSTLGQVYKYDGGTVIATGAVINISGFYTQ